MRRLSILFKDRQTSPLDTAIWWVEYVLRHRDTSHLRSKGMDQTWYQRRLLDVWTFFLMSFLTIFCSAILVLRKFVKYFKRGEQVTGNRKKIKKQ